MWHIEKGMEETVGFFVIWLLEGDIVSEMDREILFYFADMKG